MSTPPDLLRKAARCYERAGWADDACRCYEGIGDAGQAARLHEQRGRWDQAARGYEAVGDWVRAARCHERAGRPAEQAECLRQARDLLRAAWVLADGCRLYIRAESLLREARPRTGEERRALELVRARCEAGAGSVREATARLWEVVAWLSGLAQAPVGSESHRSSARPEDKTPAERSRPARRRHRQRAPEPASGPSLGLLPVVEWALAVSAAVRRPDLSTLIHAATARRHPGAGRRWEEWAREELGDITGIPAQDGPDLSGGESPVGEADHPERA